MKLGPGRSNDIVIGAIIAQSRQGGRTHVKHVRHTASIEKSYGEPCIEGYTIYFCSFYILENVLNKNLRDDTLSSVSILKYDDFLFIDIYQYKYASIVNQSYINSQILILRITRIRITSFSCFYS